MCANVFQFKSHLLHSGRTNLCWCMQSPANHVHWVNQGRALPMGIEHTTLESKPRELAALPTLVGSIVRNLSFIKGGNIRHGYHMLPCMPKGKAIPNGLIDEDLGIEGGSK